MSLFNMAFHLYNCQGDRSCRSWKYRRCCKRPSRSPLSECFSTQLECSVRISGTDRKNEWPSWRKESPRQPSRWLRSLVATRFHLPRIDFHRTALSSAAERSHLVSHLHKLGRSSQPFHPTQAEEPPRLVLGTRNSDINAPPPPLAAAVTRSGSPRETRHSIDRVTNKRITSLCMFTIY